MIAPEIVAEIRRLLEGGKISQRAIARRLGVSRGTVNAIALGRRPDYAARKQVRADRVPEPVGPPRRCPGCGGMVLMPCVACRIRALRAARGAQSRSFEQQPLVVRNRPVDVNFVPRSPRARRSAAAVMGGIGGEKGE